MTSSGNPRTFRGSSGSATRTAIFLDVMWWSPSGEVDCLGGRSTPCQKAGVKRGTATSLQQTWGMLVPEPNDARRLRASSWVGSLAVVDGRREWRAKGPQKQDDCCARRAQHGNFGERHHVRVRLLGAGSSWLFERLRSHPTIMHRSWRAVWPGAAGLPANGAQRVSRGAVISSVPMTDHRSTCRSSTRTPSCR